MDGELQGKSVLYSVFLATFWIWNCWNWSELEASSNPFAIISSSIIPLFSEYHCIELYTTHITHYTVDTRRYFCLVLYAQTFLKKLWLSIRSFDITHYHGYNWKSMMAPWILFFRPVSRISQQGSWLVYSPSRWYRNWVWLGMSIV